MHSYKTGIQNDRGFIPAGWGTGYGEATWCNFPPGMCKPVPGLLKWLYPTVQTHYFMVFVEKAKFIESSSQVCFLRLLAVNRS